MSSASPSPALVPAVSVSHGDEAVGLMAVYRAPRSALLVQSSDADALRAMKRTLLTRAWQGGLVFAFCGLGGLGVVNGSFDPEGAPAIASTDPVQIFVLGALAVGAASGLLGTLTAVLGSSLVGHWIQHTVDDEDKGAPGVT